MADGMTKIIYSGALPDGLDAGARLVEDRQSFEKIAADGLFPFDYSKVMPDKEHVGIHLIALGDFEHYGQNRNGDSFPKMACVNYHDTFVKHGHVHRHHKNKDPEARLGQIKLSAYNGPMGRIELFIHANREKCAEELTKLEKSGEVPFSMATHVAFDRCSRCQNLRKSAADPKMCDHIRYELGKVAEDGTVTCTHNDEPRFFDISFVFRPADRIAWSLKTASDGSLDSVKLAEDFGGLWVPEEVALTSPLAQQKRELLHKLAALETHFFGLAAQEFTKMTPRDRELWEMRKSAADQALSDEAITLLRDYEPADTFYHLAAAGIVLDPAAFFKYALGGAYAQLKDAIPLVKAATANGLFGWIEKTGRAVNVCNDTFYDVATGPYRLETGACSPRRLIALERPRGSFMDKYASHRAVEATIEGRPARIEKPGETFCQENQQEAVVTGLSERYATYKIAAVLAALAMNPEADSERQMASMTAQHLIK